MGKVKEAIYEIQEEIQEIIYFWKGDISLDDIKTILKNKYFFIALKKFGNVFFNP